VTPIGVGAGATKKAGANSHRPSDVALHTSASTSVVKSRKTTSAIANIPWDNHQRCLCTTDSHCSGSFQVRNIGRGFRRSTSQDARLEIAAGVTISSRDPRPGASRWKTTTPYTSSKTPRLRFRRRRPFRLIRRSPHAPVADGPHRSRKTVMAFARSAYRRNWLGRELHAAAWPTGSW
jgi:hypothetical protein